MPIATINPATGEVVRKFDPLTEAELEAKLARAEAAFKEHRRSSFSERAQKMIAVAEILERSRTGSDF